MEIFHKEAPAKNENLTKKTLAEHRKLPEGILIIPWINFIFSTTVFSSLIGLCCRLQQKCIITRTQIGKNVLSKKRKGNEFNREAYSEDFLSLL